MGGPMSFRSCRRAGRAGPCPGQWAFLAGVLALAILAASCGGHPPEPSEAREAPSPTTEVASPATEAPSPVEEVPEPPAAPPPAQPEREEPPEVPEELRFSAPLLTGGGMRGDEYAGRDVAVWFWAPW